MKKKWLLIMTVVMTIAASVPAYAGTWEQNTTGWWWQNDDHSYPSSGWEWLDGNKDGVAECYYFDQNGYLMMNTKTPDGYQVDGNGAWVINGAVQIQTVSTEKTVQVPDSESVDANGTIIRYINGIPYYTYAKEEGTEENLTSYDEIDVNELAYRIIELVNEERLKAGREELMVNEELMENGDIRAEEAHSYFRHTRPDGRDFRTAITVDYSKSSENLVGVPYVRGDSYEIIAYAAVDWWLSSSGHKKNMLDSQWEETGLGIYMEEGGFCICQMFIKN